LQPSHQTAVLFRGYRQVRSDGRQAEAVGSTSMDTTQEGFDQSFNHFTPKARTNDLRYRGIGRPVTARQEQVETGPRYARQ